MGWNDFLNDFIFTNMSMYVSACGYDHVSASTHRDYKRKSAS